jgi:hypothetical protein
MSQLSAQADAAQPKLDESASEGIRASLAAVLVSLALGAIKILDSQGFSRQKLWVARPDELRRAWSHLQQMHHALSGRATRITRALKFLNSCEIQLPAGGRRDPGS